MTELKRCPFCGGKGKISEKIVDYNGRRIYEYMCYCAECFCSTPPYPIKDDAIKVWNKRPNPWHTDTPIEKGAYLVTDGLLDYAICYFDGEKFGTAYYDAHGDGEVAKWQKIEEK